MRPHERRRERECRKRFGAFAVAKTRAATCAQLSQLVTIGGTQPGGRQPIGNAWSRRLFDGPFFVAGPPAGHRPACSLVFVQSADGNTGASEPGSLGGGATDKHLIYEGLSRVAADAVMAGAGTVRGGRIVFSVWHPELIALRASLGLPRHPVQIIATNRGMNMDDALVFNVPSLRVILLTGASVPDAIEEGIRARPWIARIRTEGGGMRVAFERLRAMGIERISCVGGRTLARELLEAQLVDDVYLTTAPRPGGEPDTPLAPWPWRERLVLRKHGTGPESGVVFEQIVPTTRRSSRT